jgi:hypothetical protein
MNVTFRCPGCQQQYKVSEGMAGMTTPCKKCGLAMVIPGPAAPPPPQASPLDLTDLLEDAAAAASMPPLPAPAARDDLPDSLEAELAERRRRKEHRERDRKVSRRFVVAVALIALGFVLFTVGYRERRLSSLAKSTPQRISLAQLAANGPGNNVYLDLTEVLLLLDRSVVQTDRGLPTYAWIPAVASGGFGQPGANRVKVIVGTNRASDAQLEDLARQTVLRGIIVNATDSLDREERELLNEGLPGVDAASCYFFRVGQRPTSAAWHLFLFGGGAILLLAGGTLVAHPMIRRILARG